jgi:hypothetical protein
MAQNEITGFVNLTNCRPEQSFSYALKNMWSVFSNRTPLVHNRCIAKVTVMNENVIEQKKGDEEDKSNLLVKLNKGRDRSHLIASKLKVESIEGDVNGKRTAFSSGEYMRDDFPIFYEILEENSCTTIMRPGTTYDFSLGEHKDECGFTEYSRPKIYLSQADAEHQFIASRKPILRDWEYHYLLKRSPYLN